MAQQIIIAQRSPKYLCHGRLNTVTFIYQLPVLFNCVYNLEPEPVRDVNIISKTRELDFSWKKPLNPFGVISRYEVIHYVATILLELIAKWPQ